MARTNDKMNYNYKLTTKIVCYAASVFLLGGCGRVEEIAKRHDEEANIRMAMGDLGKQMDRAGRGMRRLEDFLSKKAR